MSLEAVRSLFTPFLDLIQLDVTTRGPDAGRFSLRRTLKKQWIDHDLRPREMQDLRSLLKRTRMCHLQGWGEPLLNPDFFELAGIARDYGCVTTTAISDGSLLDEFAAKEMLRSGLTSVTFSISALTDRENLERRGADLSGIYRCLEDIKRLRSRHGQEAPQLNILLSLHRSDLERLEKLPTIFQGLGISALIVNPLSFTPKPGLGHETFVPADDQEFHRFRKVIKHTASKAAKRDMALYAFVVHGGKNPPRCIENITAGCFISSERLVSPCIFSSPPLRGDAHYRFQGMDLPFNRIQFGGLNRSPFSRIWHSESYRTFRKEFRRTGVPRACSGCWRPYIARVEL